MRIGPEEARRVNISIMLKDLEYFEAEAIAQDIIDQKHKPPMSPQDA